MTAQAGELPPRAGIVVLPDVSRHALPPAAPSGLGRRLMGFPS
ncbi:hypothetical protein [Streptomyces phaeoluteigriseus]|nr:hypothetical protein [Streptomyces phaeoluteigriseus]